LEGQSERDREREEIVKDREDGGEDRQRQQMGVVG
jgi:hypothetical protein